MFQNRATDRLAFSLIVVLMFSQRVSAQVTFTASRYPESGSDRSPSSVVTGDFNGDTIPDLVTIHPNQVPFGGPELDYFRFNANGTFNAPVPTSLAGLTTQTPGASTTGDFNNDGKLDLAIAYRWAEPFVSPGNVITIHLGNGNGQFTASPLLTTTTAPADLVAGDFNEDGKADLAVTSCSSGVTLHLGNGAGGFAAGELIADNFCDVGSIRKGDLNNDGNLDLLANPAVLLGNGSGAFVEHPYQIASAQFELGDFNKDGKLDLVEGAPNVLGSPLSVTLGDGTGGFDQLYFSSSAGCHPLFGCETFTGIAVADFDDDGDLDVAAAKENELVILRHDEDKLEVPIPGILRDGIVTADFNKDGLPDLIGLEHTFSSTPRLEDVKPL